MAQLVQVTVVGTPKSTFSTPQVWALPVGSFSVLPYAGTVATVNATVVVAPAGLNQPAETLFVQEAIGAIVTAANA